MNLTAPLDHILHTIPLHIFSLYAAWLLYSSWAHGQPSCLVYRIVRAALTRLRCALRDSQPLWHPEIVPPALLLKPLSWAWRFFVLLEKFCWRRSSRCWTND